MRLRAHGQVAEEGKRPQEAPAQVGTNAAWSRRAKKGKNGEAKRCFCCFCVVMFVEKQKTKNTVGLKDVEGLWVEDFLVLSC